MSCITRNGKVSFIAVMAVLAAFVSGVAYVHFSKLFQFVATDDAYVEGRIHMVASRINGTVQKVLVNDNQLVQAKDILVVIDPEDYEVRVKEAEAAYSAEKARVAESLSRIAGAQAKVEVSQAVLKQAEIDLRRAERLFDEGVLPKEKLEKSDTAATLAKAQMKAAQEEVLQAKAFEELELALVQQKEAALNTARLNLGYSKIVASSNGYVTKKAVEEGNQIQVGQPLMAIVALDDVWVVANFKETQLKNIRPGLLVEVRVDTYPGRVFTGKVDSVMAGTGAAFAIFPSENALGNYVKVVQRIPVKIVLDKHSDPEHVLRVGMSVKASVRVSHE